MPLPRMTTRRWMLAVAAVACLFFAVVEGERRRERFRHLAKYYAAEELGAGPVHPKDHDVRRDPSLVAKAKARSARLVAHYGQLKLKYLRAALRPWLPVEPDPPPPE